MEAGMRVESVEDLDVLLKSLQQLGGLKEIVELLSEGFCGRCTDLLQRRIQNLANGKSDLNNSESSACICSADFSNLSLSENKSLASKTSSSNHHENSPWISSPARMPDSVSSMRRRVNAINPSLVSRPHIVSSDDEFGEVNGVSDGLGPTVSSEQNEQIRFSQVGRKKDFVHIERVNGRTTNILKGLELHTRVFNAVEQKKIVDFVYSLQLMGQKGQLRERTYSEPKKWMRGKGRVTIQFGCCYNYAVDKNGNPPGIIRDEEVDPIPSLFKTIIKRLVRWHILPPTCVPNSCIVNIYDEGDCIPPHIDHHDFLRPFCTVSFLTESHILFGSNLKIEGPGEFSGPVSIPLPVGSVLILNGNGADMAKHCVPAVPGKRISITFRKMDDSKKPYKFLPDPELQGLQPLVYSPSMKLSVQQVKHPNQLYHTKHPFSDESAVVGETRSNTLHYGKDDFPPLGGSNTSSRPRPSRNRSQQ